MSTWEPKPAQDEFRFEDRVQIEKLLLTDKQREALRRLLASYIYCID